MGTTKAPPVLNLNQLINSQHSELFQSTERVLLVYGGSGSGKSYSTADKIILQAILNSKTRLKFIVVRKSMPALKRTCMVLMEERLKLFGIPYGVNRTDSILRIYESLVYFVSVNNITEIEKVKSFTDISMIWVEEANELSEPAIDQLDLRLRGGNLGFHQLILTFNPISTTSWIYNKYFVRKEPCQKLLYNIETNRWADQEYIKRLDALEHTNNMLWRVYRKGEWGSLEGVIYTNYDIVPKVPKEAKRRIFGLDFGYTAPSALIRCDIIEKEIWLEEKIYQTHLTNQELIRKCWVPVKKEIIYADAAEPDRIKEFNRAGFHCKPGRKGLNQSIDFIKNLKLHIIENSVNLIKEMQSYSWETDKDGKSIDVPVDFNNHLISAMHYALYTHLSRPGIKGLYGADGEQSQPEVKAGILQGIIDDMNMGDLMNMGD